MFPNTTAVGSAPACENVGAEPYERLLERMERMDDALRT